jgi:spore maturation protein CgeB
MKIGFYIQWNKGSLNSQGNVLGDELYGESMCKSLNTLKGVKPVCLYAPNYEPTEKLDVMIYMNNTEPVPKYARKHVLYMQNAYGEGSNEALQRFHQIGYDGYAFISNKLLEIHQQLGYSGIFLPFGVDTNVFYPKPYDVKYIYDVAYIGNDIKGKERTNLYLYPAIDFKFGLYGNWKLPYKLRFWKNIQYQNAFSKISQGKIKQEDVPVLYSNTKINLNCTAQDCVDWDVITLRTLEVLACKGFLISDRVAIAEKLLGNAVVFTDGGQDLKNKIIYYLSRPKERQEIAICGYEYVMRHATINARMEVLYKYLGEIV